MLAANQVMIGKCLKLKYSWKRSSVQVQSKRNFLNVSHKLREKITKFSGHVYKSIKCSNISIIAGKWACLRLNHLTYLLLYTPKYFQKALRQPIMKYKAKNL